MQGNVYMIAGGGGNTTVQIGPEAVVVVDTKTAAVAGRCSSHPKLSSKPIRHIIVTSADPDHTGGNEQVSSAGTYVRLLDTFDPRGANKNASIIAHVNVLERMSGPSGTKRRRRPAPGRARRISRRLGAFVNDEAIELVHVPAAHTDGDTMAFFPPLRRDQHGRHLHDHGYPRFDPEHGGSVTGILDGLNRCSSSRSRRESDRRHGDRPRSWPNQRRDGSRELSRHGHDRARQSRRAHRGRHDARAGACRAAIERLRRYLCGLGGPTPSSSSPRSIETSRERSR